MQRLCCFCFSPSSPNENTEKSFENNSKGTELHNTDINNKPSYENYEYSTSSGVRDIFITNLNIRAR